MSHPASRPLISLCSYLNVNIKVHFVTLLIFDHKNDKIRVSVGLVS